MSLYADKSVEVEELDNGYVLTWKDETLAKNDMLGSMYPKRDVKTRGREIFTTKTALHKRLKQLL